MSHVALSEMAIHDLDLFEKVCKEFGLILHRGHKTWKWFGRWMDDYSRDDAAYRRGLPPEQYGKGEHMVELPGCEYQIGLVKNPNGDGLVPVYDFFGPGEKIRDLFRQDCGVILQRYGTLLAKKQLVKQGFKNIKEKKVKNPKTGEMEVKLYATN